MQITRLETFVLHVPVSDGAIADGTALRDDALEAYHVR